MDTQDLITDMRVKTMKQVLLEPEAPLKIPAYQRSYAWKSDEVGDFVRDLMRLYNARKAEQRDEHFMGGIVAYIEVQSGTIPSTIYQIIDGQQRLVTFQLLFAVIRREYEQLHKKFKGTKNKEFEDRVNNMLDEVQKAFEHNETDHLGRLHPIPTLVPAEADANYLRQVIDYTDSREDDMRESHRLIRSARGKIEKDLIREIRKQTTNDEEYFFALNLLLECARKDCVVIFIVCPNLDDAYELFQVLNDRGKSLTDGDLLRAHTFQRINECSGTDNRPTEDMLRQHWNELLEEKDSVVKQFLEQYFRAITGKSPEKRQFYRQFQREVFPQSQQSEQSDVGSGNGEQDAHDTSPHAAETDDREVIGRRVRDMRDKNRVFLQLREGDWPYSTDDRRTEEYDKQRLKILVRVLGLQNLSLLMAAACKLDQPTFTEILYLTETFFFRYKTICGGSATLIGDLFGKYANKIMNDNFDMDAFKDELRTCLDNDASDSVFREQLKLNLTYGQASKLRIRFFLIYLEDHRKLFQTGLRPKQQKRDKSTIYPIERSNSVEHIYPQNPRSSAVDPGIVGHPTRGDLTHCLGNLTFLGKDDNQDLDNKPYSEKRSAFAASKVWLNQEIAKQADWTAEAILERENVLLDWALCAFKIV